jgi:hypothetical protein
MMYYKLQRLSQSPSGTFGKLFDDSEEMLCYTAELPWLNNEPDVSCIPAGVYDLIAHDSPEHPNTFEITPVLGRTGILIHNGNIPEVDSMGCVIVGTKIGFIDGQQAVLQSDIALNLLQNMLQVPAIITILDPIQPVS